MKLKLSFVAALLTGSIVMAQSINNHEIINSNYSLENSKIPTYVEFSSESRPAVTELNSLFQNYWKGKNGFGFQEIGREVDVLGFTHIRFEQTFNGVGIELAELILHTKNNEIYSFNGKLIDVLPTSSQEGLTEAAALQAAKNSIGAITYKWELPGEEAHLKREQNDVNATYFPTGEKKYMSTNLSIDPSALKLTYKFNVYAQEPLSRQEIYIDASNGLVVFSNNIIHTANVKGTANTAYSGNQIINTDSTATNAFSLNQTVSGNGVNTYNMLTGTTYTNAVNFTDADNIWNNANANLDQYATDAHWGAESTYDYFFSKYNRNSINNAGFALNSYIHYSTNYANAFWDGQRMTYGDGNANSNPLVALDIAGHEISHGLTTFSANLIYADESGALNESFSDIFGTAIEFHARPNRANWLLGEDIGGAIRSLSNPNQFGDPDTYDGINWRTTALTGGCTPSQQNDQCGVHTNSGVQNFWFYLLSVGGTGTNDFGAAYNVTGLGIDTAASIAYRNLTVYLSQSSNYADARFFSIQSATDLYGACSPQVISVTNAWHAVGVGAVYSPGVTADFIADFTNSCAPPLSVNFTNNSNNGLTFSWDFGDGSTSIQRAPAHNYVSYGKFDVTLIADGGACGIDTIVKTNYIDIDTANACTITLNSGTNATQLTCTGKLYDSGGPLSDYSANENGVITISPPNSATITLSFALFDVESGSATNICDFDVLNIYDGSSVNSPLLGSYCNNLAPPATLTSTAASVTIEFISDGGLEEAGFEIDWQCNSVSNPPSANFNVESSTACDGDIEFLDRSTQVPASWTWDFGDGNTSVQQNPIHTYTTNGMYDVKLIATNSFGTDSITKMNVVTINRPTAPTAIGDTACLGQTATITASAAGTINWYDAEFGSNQITTGNSVTIPNLTSDSILWAENYLAGPIQTVGPANNTIGTGANFNNYQYLIFDVFTKINLESVIVYAQGSGNRTIELRDAQGNVLQSLTRFVSTGGFLVGLNFDIDPGTNYQLGFPQGTQPNLYRNNTGASYPYTIPGKLTIKGSSASSPGFYYFYYNWKVKTPDCVSARVPVLAKSDTLCNLTSIASNFIETSEYNIYPNPTTNQFNIDLGAASTIKSLIIRDVTGKVIFEKALIGEKVVQINSENWAGGLYYIQLMNKNSIETKKIVISNK